MKMHSKDQIVRAMKAHYASSRTNYMQIAENYIQQTSAEILKSLSLERDMDHVEEMRFHIEWDQLRRNFPKYGSTDNQKYWFDWLNEQFPMIIKYKQGFNWGKGGSKLSLAKSVFDVEQLINEVKNVSEQVIKELNQNPHDLVAITPVDVKSLQNYIQDCLHRTGTDRYLGTLKANATKAQLIIAALDKDNTLHQQVERSQFGRLYYLGLNLQSAPKLIRRAALGDCHQYDVSSSVFVWKYDAIRAIDQKMGRRTQLRYTLDYIDYKTAHRKRLAKLTFGNNYDSSVNIIKLALTAIGFGAKATSGGYVDSKGQWQQNSIADIIRDKEHRLRFLNDDFVQGFIKEQGKINDILTEDCANVPDFVRKHHTINGRINKNKLVSYLYQRAEFKLLKAMIACVEENNNDTNLLLLTHDGFYTRRPVDLQLLRSVVKQLWPTAKIDHEEIRAFQFNKLEENPEHVAHMRWEYEQVARKLGKTLAEVMPPKQRFNPRTYTTKNEDYSGGYDDGSKAYEEPREFYLEDPELLEDPKQRAFAELYQRYC